MRRPRSSARPLAEEISLEIIRIHAFLDAIRGSNGTLNRGTGPGMFRVGVVEFARKDVQ